MNYSTTHPVPGIPYTPSDIKEKTDFTFIASLPDPNKPGNKNIMLQLMGDMNVELRHGTISQPLISSTKRSIDGKYFIDTNIFIFENLLEKLEMEHLQIYQTFTQGLDGKYQLSYNVCYNRTGRERGKIYRLHRLLITNIDTCNYPFSKIPNQTQKSRTKETLNIGVINEVVVFITNVNPETSRGTVTTVKNASGD